MEKANIKIPKTLFSITGKTNFAAKFEQLRKLPITTTYKAAKEEMSKFLNIAKIGQRTIARMGTSNLEIGSMFFYSYDALHKKRLKFWDAFPLCIPLQITDKHMLGLNLHYLHPTLRIKLLAALFPYKNSSGVGKQTQLRVSYQIVSNFTEENWHMAKWCLKKYRKDRIRSTPFKVDPREWLTAIFLPFEDFQKKSKTQVYASFKQYLAEAAGDFDDEDE